MNKDLSDLKIQEYFKKIGKNNSVRLFSLLILILVVGFFSFQTFKNGQLERSELSGELNDKETEELQLLKAKKEQDELYLLLKEYASSITEEDVHEHTLESLRFFEQLALKHSINIYLHDVNDLDYIENDDESKQHYIHIALGIEGDFESIMGYIEDIKQTDLPVMLQNTQFIIDEEEYPEDHEFEIIKSQLDIYVFEERIYVERGEGIYFDEEGILKLIGMNDLFNDEDEDADEESVSDNFLIVGDEEDIFDEDEDKAEDDFVVTDLPSISPFGMYSFEIEEEESDTYDEYQSFLQQYLDNTDESKKEDKKDDKKKKDGEKKGNEAKSSESKSKEQKKETTSGLSRYLE